MNQHHEKEKRNRQRLEHDAKSIILHNKLVIVIAVATMIVVILVLGSLLMISRHPIGSNKHLGDDKETNKSWYSDSPYLGGIEPLSSPKAPDQNRTNHPYNFQPQPTSNDPTPPSLDNYLSQVLDMSKLYDQQSPLGRAYHWIAYQDGMKYDSNYVMIVQRFVLAAFYFATGGGRTKTSWTKCSAVPPNLVLDDKTRSIRCVTDKGHEDDGIICAYTNSFRECEESDEVDYTPEPTYRKRRWLSDVVECDWYGITCNPNGHVIGLSLPQNGLNGTLLAELDFLSEMKVLNLGGNQLIGTLPEWNGLSLVEHVLLFGMNLTGQIPSTWQSWSHLQTLDLSYNKFSGLLPLPGNWIQLYLLDLTSNNLEISISAEVGRVSSLTFLSLSGNSIGMTLPEVLWSLGSLQTLDLSECGMQGSIPDDIGRLINLGEGFAVT